MRKIKESLFMLFILQFVCGCSLMTSLSKQNVLPNCQETIEINTLFNSDSFDVDMEIQSNDEINPLLNLYCDNEKIMFRYPSYPDVEEIRTHEMYYIQGHGFKVCEEMDSAPWFVNNHINAFDFMEYISGAPDYSSMNFKLNVKEFFSSQPRLFDSGEIDEIFEQLNIEKMPVNVCFDKHKVKTLTLIFDEFLPKGSTLKRFRVAYKINSYGEDLVKRSFDDKGFLKVPEDIFAYIERDIASYCNGYNGTIHISTISSSGELFINDIPENKILAEIRSSYHDNDGNYHHLNIEVRFSDVQFDENKKMCYYDFYGKIFEIHVNFYRSQEKTAINCEQTDINYCKDDPITYDPDYQRVLLKTGQFLSVLDTSTSNILKTIDVEGTIVNIVNHDNVYHVLTSTETPPYSSFYATDDEGCKGNIYVINKTTLEIDNCYEVATVPYYTAVDNRGDILITSGYGQRSPLYIYHIKTNELEIIYNLLYSQDYLYYDKDLDLIVSNATQLSGGVSPKYFYYEDGRYILKTDQKSSVFTDYGSILFTFKNYIVSKYPIFIEVSDWYNPKKYYPFDSCFSADEAVPSFCDENTIFSVIDSSKNDDMFIMKVDFTDAGFEKTLFNVKNERASDYSFGFANNDVVYLYNSNTKTILTFDLNA